MTPPHPETPDSSASPDWSMALLIDGFDRVRELVPEVIDGLSVDELTWRPDAAANSIGWLLWHLTRVQDDHLAGITGEGQVWAENDWAARFELPYDTAAIGYGQSSEEVGEFRLTEPALLVSYYEVVAQRTSRTLSSLRQAELDRVLDASYDPPVTVAVRLVSVLNDVTQHVGQAAYVKGLVERRRHVQGAASQPPE